MVKCFTPHLFFSLAVFISLYAWLAATQMVKAAGNMHAAMLDRVLRSPMSFFDTTPSGRIVNRSLVFFLF